MHAVHTLRNGTLELIKNFIMIDNLKITATHTKALSITSTHCDNKTNLFVKQALL